MTVVFLPRSSRVVVFRASVAGAYRSDSPGLGGLLIHSAKHEDRNPSTGAVLTTACLDSGGTPWLRH